MTIFRSMSLAAVMALSGGWAMAETADPAAMTCAQFLAMAPADQMTATSAMMEAHAGGAMASGDMAATDAGAMASGDMAATDSGAMASGDMAASDTGAMAAGDTMAAADTGAMAAGDGMAADTGAMAPGGAMATEADAAALRTACQGDAAMMAMDAMTAGSMAPAGN